MKVALLTDGIYPYAMGGMQKHSYYLAKYLALNKIEVDLYHFSQNDTYDIHQLEFFSEEEKKYIHSILIPFTHFPKLPGHYLRESYHYSGLIYRALKKHAAVDFIYAQGFTGWKIIEAKKLSEKLPPLALNFHGMEPFQKAIGLRAKLQQQLLIGAMRYNLKNADLVYSLGGKLTSMLLAEGISKTNIKQIPIGLEPAWISDKVHPSGQVLRFVFIGRYERRKGIEELNKVLKDLLGKEKFEFHFIGPIPDKKRISSRQLIYHGSIIDQSKIQKIIRSCDILVSPSFAEGMPTVILEAMASGLAVIATDVGAVSELVSAKTGWLVAAPKTKLLKAAFIASLKVDAKELLNKKENSRELVKKHYLWDEIIAQTISSIQETIKQV